MIAGATGGTSPWLRLVDVQEQYGRHILAAMLGHTTAITHCCDLGIGAGDDVQVVRRHFPQARLAGIDCTDQHRVRLEAEGIAVTVLDLERAPLPFADDSLDLVIANQVYEHLKEIFWVSHQVSRSLKLHGYLYIGVPNLHALHNRLLFPFGVQPSQAKSYSAHVRGFGAHEIPRFLDTCFPGGYRLLQRGGAQMYPFPKTLARWLCAGFPSLAHSMFYLFQKVRPYTDAFLAHPIDAALETNFYLGPDTTHGRL